MVVAQSRPPSTILLFAVTGERTENRGCKSIREPQGSARFGINFQCRDRRGISHGVSRDVVNLSRDVLNKICLVEEGARQRVSSGAGFLQMSFP